MPNWASSHKVYSAFKNPAWPKPGGIFYLAAPKRPNFAPSINKTMKKILFVFFAFMLVKANAQSADDVIKNYTNAMGGLDKFNAIKTLKMSGTVTVQGMDLPITIQIIN